jgi:hypothetical protein
VLRPRATIHGTTPIVHGGRSGHRQRHQGRLRLDPQWAPESIRRLVLAPDNASDQVITHPGRAQRRVALKLVEHAPQFKRICLGIDHR